MADLINYNVADYQNPDEATKLGTNQGQASQNVLANTNKNYKSGADYIKGLWNSPNKSDRFQAISNVLGNVIGATGNALKGEGSKGTQWNDFVNRYNDTMQKAGEQAAQDTSTNVNTANVNAMNRDQAEQQLAQARDIGKSTDAATEANIVRGQNLLGGASAKDRILTDLAAAATNALYGANNGTETKTDTDSGNTEPTKAQDFQNDLNDDYDSAPAKFADWVNDEAKLQSMVGKWTNEDIKNLPGLGNTVRDGPTIKNFIKKVDLNKGFGSQSEDVKKAFYSSKELKKLNSGKVTDAEKIAIGKAAQARYANFLEMLER